MSRKSRKRLDWIADWQVSDAEVAGWFWHERLAARKKRRLRGQRDKFRSLTRKIYLSKFTHKDGLPF